MKKIYSLIAISLLSATTLMAQTVLPSVKTAPGMLGTNGRMQTLASKPSVKTAGAIAPQSIAGNATTVKSVGTTFAARSVGARSLTNNQIYYGAYTSDSYENSSEESGLGFPTVPGRLKIAADMPLDALGKLDGSKITGLRFALSQPAHVYNVFVYTYDKKGIISSSPVATRNISGLGDTKAGWTELTFTTPYTIDLSTIGGLLIGYEYNQIEDKTNPSSHPLSVVAEGMFSSSVYLFYNGTQGLNWYTTGLENYGNLSVQMIVEDDKFLTNDIQMLDMSTTNKDWFKKGNKMGFRYAISNFGKKTAANVEIGVYVDNNLNTAINAANIGQDMQILDEEITLPAEMAAGEHILTLIAYNADGEKLTLNTDDDRLDMYFYVYEKSLPRQKQLMEQFTSQEGLYCLEGEHNLNEFAKTRDDLAWVALHGDMATDKTDQFTNTNGTAIMKEVNAYMLPSVAFNRTYMNDGINNCIAISNIFDYDDTPGNREKINEYLNEVVDYTNEKAPSFATIDIKGTYTGSRLSATVYGTGVHVSEILKNNYKLTVLLTEDKVAAKQIMPDGTYRDNYVHNHVLRDLFSCDLNGSDVVWDGDKYEVIHNFGRLHSGWKGDNMNVVAFISPKVNSTTPNYRTQWVTNANCIAATDLAVGTGISGVTSNENVVEVARYNAAGQAITAPQKGLNIIKMSNGTTKKVIIK